MAHISEAPSHIKDGATKESAQSDVVSRETECILAVKAESQTEDVIRIPPSPSPKPRCGVPNANLTLRVTYSSEDGSCVSHTITRMISKKVYWC